MSLVVETHSGRRLEIDTHRYWHMVDAPNAWFFHNNVRVACGELTSVSAIIAADPRMKGAVTPYSFAKRDDRKEQLFERIRTEKYASHPTRLKSVFVFDDYALVERAQREWFRD